MSKPMSDHYKYALEKAQNQGYPTDKKGQLEELANHPQLKSFAEDRAIIAKDPHAPAYHFYAPYLPNRINDPNGLCFWNGLYHLFYQQYPYPDAVAHWGHLVSKDLTDWKELPTAIFPGPEERSYSGSAFVEEDRAYAMYHGVDIGNLIAQSDDPLLLNWEKRTGAAVIPQTDYNAMGEPYRIFDPCLWKEGDTYYSLSGTCIGGEKKKLYGQQIMMPWLFSSKDLDHWTFEGAFIPHNPYYGKGNDCATPYFWPIGDKWLFLHSSHTSGSHCMIGSYDQEKHEFLPEQYYPLSMGEIMCGGLHAPCAMPDGNGGCYVVFNTKDAWPTGLRQGAMSLTRHFTLGEDGRLRMKPVESVKNLRREHAEYKAAVADRETYVIENAGNCYELDTTIDLKDARVIKLRVLSDSEHREHTDIVVNIRREEEKTYGYAYGYMPLGMERIHLTMDSSESSLLPDVWSRPAETLETAMPIAEKLHLRVFVDRSIVEVYLNDRLALVQTVYPTLKGSRNIELTAIGSDVDMNADLWQMAAIHPDDRSMLYE